MALALNRILFVWALCLSFNASSELLERLEVHGQADLRWVYADGEDSWLRRGAGSNRFDEHQNNTVQLADVGLGVDLDLSLQSSLTIQGHYYGSQTEGVEITEAYWQYRPLLNQSYRSRYRLGLFYPAISLENRSQLWSSAYVTNYSAINSWMAEELRLVGAEGRWDWKVGQRQGANFSVTATVFSYNDPTGAVLAWKGWSNHDRQTGFGGSLPLQATPGTGVTVNKQDTKYKPFMEIDSRPGFFVSAKWSQSRKYKIELAYYDNRAKDTEFEHGQYAWHTEFYHLGVHRFLTEDLELFGQYINGSTSMGNGFVDNQFESVYVSLARRWGRNRINVRLEHARVEDLDKTPDDPNDDIGNSLTLSYSYLMAKHWKLNSELNLRSSKQSRRLYQNVDKQLSEIQYSLSMRYFF